MSKNLPVDPRVRLAISRWPDDAPRGTVTTFCAEHDISRKTFYALRKRALSEGQSAVLTPRSRRPRTTPTQIPDRVKQEALEVRAALEASGLDHGPISVHDKMKVMGLIPPSESSLARIFREAGVARLEPKKKPRAAFRRFVYPAPNACWQLDATEYVLEGGRKCVIFQLQDDHSRSAVASHVAGSETSEAALFVFKKGVAAQGVPQRLLTDNGVALNPSRRGWDGQLTKYAKSLGVEPITGKPGKPTTQGKNERFHQTLFRWLNQQPLATSIAELQELVDRFDIIYNTQRPHQGLPGRITPQQAWNNTPIATPPRPPRSPSEIHVPSPPGQGTRLGEQSSTLGRGTTARGRQYSSYGDREVVVGSNGTVTVNGIRFMISYRLTGHPCHAVWDPDGIVFATNTGEVIAEYQWPPTGTIYVSNGHPRGGSPRSVTDVLTHGLSPMS